MTELPTLRASLRETAERRYARRRRRPLRATALAALAVAAALIVSGLDTSEPADEVPATPIPTPTQKQPRIPAVTAIHPDAPELKGLERPPHEIVAAWSVPALKGHVILAAAGGSLCLSAPDPASANADVERGGTCDSNRYGMSLGVGNTIVGVPRDGARLPTLRLPDGSEQTLEPHDRLIVLLNVPSGSTVTFYDGNGEGRPFPIRDRPPPPGGEPTVR